MNREAFEEALERAPTSDLINIIDRVLRNRGLQDIAHLIDRSDPKETLKTLLKMRVRDDIVAELEASTLFPALAEQCATDTTVFATWLTKRVGLTLAAKVLAAIPQDELRQLEQDCVLDPTNFTREVENYYVIGRREIVELLSFVDQDWLIDFICTTVTDPTPLFERALEEIETILAIDLATETAVAVGQ